MPRLFQAPDARLLADMEAARAVVEDALPLSAGHKRLLPQAVRELSLLLTRDRSRARAYWEQPRFLAAYLRYFLPWNLLRLAWLLPGLALPLSGEARILDLGSGPLTLPIALWLAKPELRRVGLRLICADTAPRPLEAGARILQALQAAAPSGGKPWETRPLRSGWQAALSRHGPFQLILAGNLLNELPPRCLPEFFQAIDRALLPGGRVFILEPGARLGGRLIAGLRREALGYGWEAAAPCPHQAPCPLLPSMERQAARSVGWCHFSLPADAAAPGLMALSRAAGLAKESLHLSCLLVHKPAPGGAGAPQPAAARGGATFTARIISGPIALPGGLKARYACTPLGLGLLPDSRELHSGAQAEARLPEQPRRDAKSRAWLLAKV